MSLQFIFGNSGSGKSYYLYETIIQESMTDPETNYIVLVPEQFTMQTQKDLCTMHPRGGIMNIDVLSFVRLSHRVFEEVGRETKRILDDEGKNLILRKIAGQYEEKLKVLRGNLKKQGYISEVKSVLSEFTQYGVGFEELDRFMETLEPESYLYYKLQDIRMVYEGFEDYLADKYITKEELLDVLSDTVPESQLLKDSVIVLDGFTGFTPVQNKLLGELLKVCRKVMITVVMDEREDPFSYRHPYQLFGISKHTVTSLMKIASEQNIDIEDPVYLYEKPFKRFENAPELAHLEAELFRAHGKPYAGVSRAISLHRTRNPKQEAAFTAAQIRRLVRTKGYRYRDIAVIVSNLDGYADALEEACAVFEIPVFMDNKKSILLNAYVEYVRSLLSMIEQGFSYEGVFRFLRTGMAGFSREETDHMENYVLALGLKGYKKWQAAWVRRTSFTDEEELAFLNSLRVRFVEKIDGLVTVLRKRKKTVEDISLAVYEFLVQEQMQLKIQKTEERFTEQGELALAKEYSQVYRIVIELLDKFVELLGSEMVSLKEYCELLDAGLEEAKVGVIPPSLDQVVIGDVERTRLNHLKVLFFLGANDVLLPGNLGQGGLLSERDREQFEGKNLTLSPGAKEKIYIQKFYLYMNLTKPSEKLFVSFSKSSQDGKALRPAYLVQELMRMFPGLSVMEEEERPLHEQELNSLTAAYRLARGLAGRTEGLDDSWKELYTWFVRREREAETAAAVEAAKGAGREPETAAAQERTGVSQIRRMLDAAFYKKGAEHLQKDTAAELYGDLSRASVTRLERFASCAYAHFLAYGLRLGEREQYSFEPMDLGNVAHQSMERFARKADEQRMDWTEMPEELQNRLVEESVEESIVEYGNTVLYSSARNEYTITRMKRLLKRSVWALTKQMAKGDFRPSGYELKFGSGKIDRIDTCEDEEHIYVKVTDYKTGMKSFDITAFYHGLQMQLPVYLNAALDIEKRKSQKHTRQEGMPEKDIVPAGIFYYRMRDPFVEKEKNEQVLEEKILRQLRLDGLVNADESVIEHLERGLSGTSNYVPLSRNKDGSLGKMSKVLTPAEFEEFLKYTKKKEADLKQKIASGDVQAAPYKLSEQTGCDYCPYASVCGFDVRLDGCGYRELKKYPQEEIMEQIRKEQEGNS